ncbi:MAG: (d)CMP kinase [Holosporaceae bacterium]|nr:(d)CMP kinase [Holosporaceae bacterium]
MIVAIDGPAGSGKGTIASMLAEYFGFKYVDSGLLYRKVAAASIWAPSVDLQDAIYSMDFSKDVLRSEEVGARASEIAGVPQIRSLVTELSRRCAQNIGPYAGVVMDGRDIGTVVFPGATCKIYLTASPEVRAKRRLAYINRHGSGTATYEEVYENILERDSRDSSREIAPLTISDDYVVIDTSNEIPKESFSRIKKIVENIL